LKTEEDIVAFKREKLQVHQKL